MVVIHCTVDVSTRNSRMSSGNSTVITVSVRIPMKDSDPVATIDPIRLFEMRPSSTSAPPSFDISAPFDRCTGSLTNHITFQIPRDAPRASRDSLTASPA